MTSATQFDFPTLTKLELDFLQACHRNDYASIFDYGGEDSTWVFAAVDGCQTCTPSQARGVMVSLQSKGLITLTQEQNPDDSTVSATELGVKWAKANYTDVDD